MASRKVTIPVINGIERMFKAGTKQKYIAKAYNISVATVQNVKKTGFNYENYNNLVDKQLNKWKLNKTDNTLKATKNNVTLTEAEPAAACAFKAYFPAVPPEEWFKETTSVAAIVELVRVKETMVSAAKAALFIVIVPHFLLKVTAVDFEVACVTAPPSPVI